ncbi:MAG: polyprenyl synthetase family protein [Chlamydiia bacterium]
MTSTSTLLPLPPQLASFKEALDQRLLSLVQSLEPSSLSPVFEEILHGGKRLRPLLLLATAEGLGTSWSSALEVACSLECLHLASLTCENAHHTTTHGSHRPSSTHTPHDLFVLSSQALVQFAYEIVSNQEHLSPTCRLSLISKMSHYAGGEQLIRGQVRQLQLRVEDLSPDQIWEVHRLKTGSLMRCALECASVLAHTSQVTCKRLGLIGEELGIAHQLIEDILLMQTAAHSDHRRPPTISAVEVLGVALARSQALQLLDHAAQRIRQELRHPDHLLHLAERLVHRLH